MSLYTDDDDKKDKDDDDNDDEDGAEDDDEDDIHSHTLSFILPSIHPSIIHPLIVTRTYADGGHTNTRTYIHKHEYTQHTLSFSSFTLLPILLTHFALFCNKISPSDFTEMFRSLSGTGAPPSPH
jgi:hypothetical protein